MDCALRRLCKETAVSSLHIILCLLSPPPPTPQQFLHVLLHVRSLARCNTHLTSAMDSLLYVGAPLRKVSTGALNSLFAWSAQTAIMNMQCDGTKTGGQLPQKYKLKQLGASQTHYAWHRLASGIGDRPQESASRHCRQRMHALRQASGSTGSLPELSRDSLTDSQSLCTEPWVRSLWPILAPQKSDIIRSCESLFWRKSGKRNRGNPTNRKKAEEIPV